jgi:hypothetical protein
MMRRMLTSFLLICLTLILSLNRIERSNMWVLHALRDILMIHSEKTEHTSRRELKEQLYLHRQRKEILTSFKTMGRTRHL